MPSAVVIGGGLAGMAAAAALGEAGYQVDLFESRPFLGGRASSYPLPHSGAAEAGAELIDNCQHVLLRCCSNLLDLYRRLNVASLVKFHRKYYYVEPGGRLSVLQRGILPSPLHFAPSLLSLRFLGWRDKAAIARALLAIGREQGRTDLDHITMGAWLRQHGQTPAAIRRFWNPILVSAINEDPERFAAAHGFQVFSTALLGDPAGADIGIPTVPLGRLYASEAWNKYPCVKLHCNAAVESAEIEHGQVKSIRIRGRQYSADAYICAVPFERVAVLFPQLGLDFRHWEHSPITGVHLWFDRPVTRLPYAALLDRTIQWFFNKSGGEYLQVVISASRPVLESGRNEVIAMAVQELGEFLPAVAQAKLVKAHVVKEVRATFSARPGLEALRPPQRTPIPNLFLAGDYTRTGWPATMEGAVRGGYLAAAAVRATLG